MNTPEIEIFLAKLYTDQTLLNRFVADPSAELAAYKYHDAALSADAIDSLVKMNMQDLLLAAQSYTHKRQQYQRSRISWMQRLFFLKKAT